MSTYRRAGRLSVCALTVAVMTLAGSVGPADADLVTLTDLNSTVEIDTSSVAGVHGWTVDGVDHLDKQWFWYRVGGAGAEGPIDTLTQSGIVVSDGNFNAGNDQVTVQYTGTGFVLTLTMILTGGTAGSGTSNLAEAISIQNTTADPLEFHFFQYVNFDLAGTPGSDEAQISGSNTAVQQDGVVVTETVVTQPANHYEVGLSGDAPSILTRLQDAGPTTLGDVSGPASGDALWAFQWDKTIDPGGTLLISKGKHIEVPEPATVGFLALGGVLLVAGALRRRRSQ